MIGQVMWELIGPLDDESIFARFLAEKGGGVHHIAVRTPNFEETVAMQTKRGNELPLSCAFGDIKIAYLPTEGDLGVIIEVFSGMPSAERVQDAA
jgi:methylmalonyl-CoA/ethylmalonyl-CoA epimerase